MRNKRADRLRIKWINETAQEAMKACITGKSYDHTSNHEGGKVGAIASDSYKIAFAMWEKSQEVNK